MAYSSQGRLLGAAMGIGVGVSLVSYFVYKYAKREVIPNKWKQVGTLDEIHFFPIKSCAPVELDKALCENLGVQEGDIKDRALMVIDKSGQIVTARGYPKMVLIVSRIVSRLQLEISAPGMENLDFDYSVLADESYKNTKATIYGQSVIVKDCGDKFNVWFSKYILGQPEGLRLVYYPHASPTRPVHKEFLNGIFSNKDTGTFHDVSSYHLINNTSVNDLNSRLKNKIFPRQFRSNLYVNTPGSPYEEDSWQWVRIGENVVFRNIAPCFRCIMPNINPFTAERDPDCQPLKAMKTYRIDPSATINSPVMGIEMGLRSSGIVKKGDAVYVEDLTK